MGRRGYPPEFRRRALDLLTAGRKVADLARDLGISDQTLYAWRRQDQIDRGLVPGLRSDEREELAAARRRIRELEAELEIHRRASELLTERSPPGRRFAAIEAMASEGHSVHVACRVLAVSESGFYAQRDRPPSARTVRHAWLTGLIAGVHQWSRGTYGARRIHAELVLGQGVAVGRCAVELLMARAGLAGLSGRPRFRRLPHVATAGDRVERQFRREEPDRLWVTDITEHPTREGKVYCAVVLDAFSRRVVGWSIDASPTAALVTNALGMAIDQREPDGTVIHSDQGTQFTSWAFTRRALDSGLLPSMGSVGSCFDNAMMESFWSRMQVELLDRRHWRTRVELANAIFEYLEIFHNRQRRHSALGMLAPIEFETRHQSATVA